MKSYTTTVMAAAALTLSTLAFGHAHPSHAIGIVAPTVGTMEEVARRVAAHFSEHLDQQFFLDNARGDGRTPGSSSIASTDTDGHALLVQASPMFALRPGW